MNNLIGDHGVFRDGRNVGTVTVSEEGLMTVLSCSCEMITGGVPRLAGVSGGEFVNIGVAAPDAGRLRLRKSYTRSALGALNLDEHTSFYLIFPGETLGSFEPPEDAQSVKLTLGARHVSPEQDPELTPIPEPVPIPEPELPELAIPASPPAAPRISEAAALPEIAKPALPPEAPAAKAETTPELPREDTPPPGEWKPINDPSALFSDGDIAEACRNARGALTTERGGFLMLAIPVSSGEPFPMMPVFCFGTSETIGGAEYIVFKTKNGNLAV